MKIVSRLSLLLLALGLVACDGVVVIVPPEVTATGTVGTNFQATLDEDEGPEDVICDDRTTELSYSFTFTGNLTSWTSYLRGVTTGEEAGRESFTLNSNKVQRDGNTVTVTYTIPPGQAPLLTDGGISTEAITVVPSPKVIGETQLFLELEGITGEPTQLSGAPISVVNNCPEDIDEDEPVKIVSASYDTDFITEVDGANRAVICNDRETAYSYTFTYSGNLEGWQYYFKDTDSAEQTTAITRTLAPGQSNVVIKGNTVTVFDSLPAGDAPVFSSLSPQGIVVTPAPIGEVELFIVAETEDAEPYRVQPSIPVFATCGEEQKEDVAITGSSYSTGFITTIDSKSREIICDDRRTDMLLDFEYTGDLESFNIYFEGKRSQDRSPTVTYTDAQISNIGFFSGVFRFEPGEAPRIVASGEGSISTQAIIVTPTIVGESIPYIQPNGEGDFIPLDVEIPIAQTCPN